MKPLGHKAYGSIPHLPNSRLGPADKSCHEGQARICTEKARDKHDRIVVQEKLDGSCTAVALLEGVLLPLTRAGWPASTSKFEQHWMFEAWVYENEDRFRAVLNEGERIVGEWIAQAHGTIYYDPPEPWAAFDIMRGTERVTFDEFHSRMGNRFYRPSLISQNGPMSVDVAMEMHQLYKWDCDQIEGVVYRVERNGKVDFLAKYVRPDKVDGKYLPEQSGGKAIWNWRPRRQRKS